MNAMVLEPYVLALAAALGAYIRARWTTGQDAHGRETLQDIFFAGVLGMMWTYNLAVDLPVLGQLEWPPFQFPLMMALPLRAAAMMLMASLFIGVIKKILMQFPTKFEAITGTAVSPKNGGPNAPTPAPPAPPAGKP